MDIVLDTGWGPEEAWAFVKDGSRMELGAQVSPSDQPAELAVVWRAAVECSLFQEIVRLTYEVLPNHTESFRGKLTGYGPTKEFLDLHQFITGEITPNFDAYRAELETPEDTVLVWGNVKHGDHRSLADAADNIGMRVPLRSFNGWSRELIAYAVSSTTGAGLEKSRRWLDAAVARLIAYNRSVN